MLNHWRVGFNPYYDLQLCSVTQVKCAVWKTVALVGSVWITCVCVCRPGAVVQRVWMTVLAIALSCTWSPGQRLNPYNLKCSMNDTFTSYYVHTTRTGYWNNDLPNSLSVWWLSLTQDWFFPLCYRRQLLPYLAYDHLLPTVWFKSSHHTECIL
jgi:hypothetical protein